MVKTRANTLQLLSRLLIIAAAAAIIVGGIVAWQQHAANRRADETAAKQQNSANHGHATGSNPSTQIPAQSTVDTYQVAADLPRYIFIPKLSVKAMVKQVGLTRAGAVGAPTNVYDTAWYNGSAKPGQPGAMLIDGHISSWTTNGVFYNLKKLVPGDEIKIERGDGKVISYKVLKSQTYAADKVDMAKVLAPVNPDKPGLNLMTCAGDVIKGTTEFNQRVVVFAEEI